MQTSSFVRKTKTRIVLSCLSVAAIAPAMLVPLTAQAQEPTPTQSELQIATKAADKTIRTQAKSASTTYERVDAEVADKKADLYVVTYDQKVKGHRVIGGETTVITTGDGQVRDVITDEKLKQLPSRVDASITAAQALKAGKALFTSVRNNTDPELVIFAQDGYTPTPAWRFDILGTKTVDGKEQPSSQRVNIDAKTGKLIHSDERIFDAQANGYHNGRVDIDVSRGASFYSNTINDVCTEYWPQNDIPTGAAPYGNGSGLDKTTGCVDAIYAAEKLSGMLTNWLGRNGIDGNGGWKPIRLGLDDVNAYYNGWEINIGHNTPNTSYLNAIDVVAHEYGHGIFENTGFGAENGGLHEAYGDIFGTLAEFYANNGTDRPDYTIGEKADAWGNGRVFRDMAHPSTVGGPDCFTTDAQMNRLEVHDAAGPYNHFFYLMAEGSNPAGGRVSPTCNNTRVQGIGIQDAGRVAYGALQRRANNSYSAMGANALLAARDLFRNDCVKFDRVKAALQGAGFPVDQAVVCGNNQPNPGQPNPGQPNPGQPNPGQPNPGQPNPDQPQPGNVLNDGDVLVNGVAGNLPRINEGDGIWLAIDVPFAGRTLDVTLNGNTGRTNTLVFQKETKPTVQDIPFYVCSTQRTNTGAATCSVRGTTTGRYWIWVRANQGYGAVTTETIVARIS